MSAQFATAALRQALSQATDFMGDLLAPAMARPLLILLPSHPTKEDPMSQRTVSTDVEGSADTCLVGTLDTWPLADLLLWMHETRRTGMVRLGAGLDAGVVFFQAGVLFRCEWGELGGEHAIIALLGMTEGSFSIIQRPVPDARPNVSRPTPELLFQCAVALDERRRPQAV
jgi:hypothetical protein